MERCLGRGAGSGEGIGGERLNSSSSMGLELKSESGSSGSVGGGCCSCGSRPTNGWKTDLMKFVVEERGMPMSERGNANERRWMSKERKEWMSKECEGWMSEEREGWMSDELEGWMSEEREGWMSEEREMNDETPRTSERGDEPGKVRDGQAKFQHQGGGRFS